MSDAETAVAAHHAGAGLPERIIERLAAAGIVAGAIAADHLKAVDEFHIGGAEATTALLDQLEIGPATRVLDIGSGIGGPARTIAGRYGARVTGVDLTPDFAGLTLVARRDRGGIARDFFARMQAAMAEAERPRSACRSSWAMPRRRRWRT